MKFIFLAAGGAIGALMRYGVSTAAYVLMGQDLPWGTLSVNLIGSFFIGLLAGLFEVIMISPNVRVFLFIGILGAFTTFSTYSFESLELIRDGEYRMAALNLILNNLFGLIFVFSGFMLSRYILSFSGVK